MIKTTLVIQMKPAKSKRVAVFDGRAYKVRSDTIEIPDFTQMTRTDALLWLIDHTYAKGYSKPSVLLPNIGITVRS